MIRKYATLQVLDAWQVPARATTGRLRKLAHRVEFDYTPRPGYLYVRSRAISSRANDNHDEFPAFDIEAAYKSFLGKPVFVNHHNANHRRARGVIVAVALHRDRNPDGSPDTWAEVLQEIDAQRFPKLCKAIISGRVNRTSMGVDVERSVCSACGNEATDPAQYCHHLPALKGRKIRKRGADGKLHEEIIREICHGLSFFENSLLVEEPADPTAYVLGKPDARGMSVTAGLEDWRPSEPEDDDPEAEQARYDREFGDAAYREHVRARDAGDKLFEHFTEHQTRPLFDYGDAPSHQRRRELEEHQNTMHGLPLDPQASEVGRGMWDYRRHRVTTLPGGSEPFRPPPPQHWSSRKTAADLSKPHPSKLQQPGGCRLGTMCSYGGTHCLACGEQVRISLHHTHLPGGGWSHHDAMKRDHPALPADPEGVIASIPAQMARRDQIRSQVADTFHRQLEEYGGSPLPRRRRDEDQMPPDPFLAMRKTAITGEHAEPGDEIFAEPTGRSPVADHFDYMMEHPDKSVRPPGSGRFHSPEEKAKPEWVHPHMSAPDHGPYYVTRKPDGEQRDDKTTYHVLDREGRDTFPLKGGYKGGMFGGAYGAYKDWYRLQHHDDPGEQRLQTMDLIQMHQAHVGDHPPQFPHTRIDPYNEEVARRPDARVHEPQGHSHPDEYHGSYEVVKHPGTGRFHVVDNAGRQAGGPYNGFERQMQAERSRDYVERRQRSKEIGRGIAESIFSKGMEIIDPGGTEESRRSERNTQAGQELMTRYAGGRGKIKMDPEDEGGEPYYERDHYLPNGKPSGWYAKHYGGTHYEIFHRGTGDTAHDAVFGLPSQPGEHGEETHELHRDFDDIELGKHLKAWHDEPDGMRNHLETESREYGGHPGIQAWKRRHGSKKQRKQAAEAEREHPVKKILRHLNDGHGIDNEMAAMIVPMNAENNGRKLTPFDDNNPASQLRSMTEVLRELHDIHKGDHGGDYRNSAGAIPHTHGPTDDVTTYGFHPLDDEHAHEPESQVAKPGYEDWRSKTRGRTAPFRPGLPMSLSSFMRMAARYEQPADHPFFQSNPVDHENIVSAFHDSTNDERSLGMRWYSDGHHVAKAIAGGDAAKGAGVLSAYSPRTTWPANLINASHALTHPDNPPGPGSGAMSMHQKPARRILAGEHHSEVLNGPKTRAFAHLLEHGGDTDEDRANNNEQVVIDRHALSTAIGRRVTDDDVTRAPLDKQRYYDHVADAYRRAADVLTGQLGRRISPHQVQAIVWLRQQRKNREEDEGQSFGGRGRLTRERNSTRAWHELAHERHPDIEQGNMHVHFDTGEEHAHEPVDSPPEPAVASSGSKEAMRRQAYNEVKVPPEINTLRQEECPVCGEAQVWTGQRCPVCGYVAPPDLFRDPDTSKAKSVRDELTDEGDVDLPPEGQGSWPDADNQMWHPDQIAPNGMPAGPPMGGPDETQLAQEDGDEIPALACPACGAAVPPEQAQEGDPCPECGQAPLQAPEPAEEGPEGAEGPDGELVDPETLEAEEDAEMGDEVPEEQLAAEEEDEDADQAADEVMMAETDPEIAEAEVDDQQEEKPSKKKKGKGGDKLAM